MNGRFGIALGSACVAMMTGCSTGWVNANETADLTVMIGQPEVARAASLHVETEAGDVTIKPAEGNPRILAHVRAQTRARADATTVHARLEQDSILSIGVDWPDGKRRHNESCNLTIFVPSMNGVEVWTNAGDLDISGMAGLLDLHTSAGDVEIASHQGEVRLRTSAGDVALRDISGPISIETSAGDIRLIRVDGPVEASTSAGDVYAELNAGYTGQIRASTTAGDINLNGSTFRGRHGQVAVGSNDSGVTSTFETTAGDVEVKVRSE